MLVIGTKGGAVIDLRMWIRVMLSRHFNKPKTLSMMARLSLAHLHDQHCIVALSSDAAILREIYVRVTLDHKGVLKSNCASYQFGILGEGELARCKALVHHYRWIDGLAS